MLDESSVLLKKTIKTLKPGLEILEYWPLSGGCRNGILVLRIRAEEKFY